MKRVTIKDIAKYLNINPSTVSRALRNHSDVSSQLKEQVTQLANKLGYKPNHAAINLRKGKSNTIGLIIPEISTYFAPSVIRAVEDITHDMGYNLLILQSNDSVEREIQNVEICAQLGVEGILISLTKESTDLEHFSELAHLDTKIVFFDKTLHEEYWNKVTIPDKKATTDAVVYLTRMGKGKKIAGIFGDERLSITQDRLTAYKDTLAELKFKYQDNKIQFASNALAAEQSFMRLWNSESKPQLLFIMSDEILEGVAKAIYKLKINVPDEIKIVALSDGYLPSILSFKVPYIQNSGFSIGLKAAQELFDLIKGKTIEHKKQYIDTPLIK
jgi:LacI family transcriptional regulator